MARKWTNLKIPGALHFITGNIYNRIPIFRRESCCLEFFKIASELRTDWPAKVIAYVLMPDHFHLIVNPQDGNITGFAGALKGKVAMKMIEITGQLFALPKPRSDGAIHEVWQDSFKAIPLWSAWMIWQKINYIHANPVKAGLVKSAREYRWSSFRAFYTDLPSPLPIDVDWWWPDDAEKLSRAMKELGWKTYHNRVEK